MENKDYSNEIDLRRFLRELKTRKWLYTAIFVIVFGAAIAYVCRKEPEYTAHSTLLIEASSSESQGRGGSLMQMMRVFSTGGFASSSVDNELLLVNTHDLVLRTVKAMGLNINCVQKNGLAKRTLFLNAPLSLSIPEEVADTLSEGYNVEVKIKDGKADITAYRGRFFKKTLLKENNVSLPCTFSTPSGPFTIIANGQLPAKATYIFGVTGYTPCANAIYEDIEADISDKMADGIEFSYTSPNKDKAIAVLNTMMSEYNAKRIERNKETALIELNFLTDRINSLYTDLVESEAKVAKFKTEQQFVDIEAEAPILLETSMDAQEQLLKASALTLYYEQVLELLRSGKDGMLPAVTAPGEDSKSQSSSMVTEYNTQMALLLELRRSAKPGNNALKAAEHRVAEMKESIISSFSQLLKASQRTIATRSSMVGEMKGHIRKLPAVEKEYINLSRDQLLNNELYAFLVEKRESALLKLNSQETLGFIIDPAYTDPKPSLKKTLILLLAGLVAAIFCSLCLAFIFYKRTNKIYNSYDLKTLGLESGTIECSINSPCANDIRTMVLNRIEKGTVFVAGHGGAATVEIANQIEKSFAAAGLNCGNYKVEGQSNDSLLSTESQDSIRQLLKSHRYVFVSLPDFEQTKDIANVIDSDTNQLIIIIEKGSLGIDGLKRAIGAIDIRNIIIAIVSV